ANGGTRPFDEVIPEDAESREGPFTTHRVEERLYFEIPDSALGREMLLLGRPGESSQNTGFSGGGARMIVEWERLGDRIVFREKLYDAVADTSTAIWSQVRGMRQGPVIGVFGIETFAPGDSAAVVDVTALYTSPNEQMGSVDGLQRDRSWVD